VNAPSLTSIAHDRWIHLDITRTNKGPASGFAEVELRDRLYRYAMQVASSLSDHECINDHCDSRSYSLSRLAAFLGVQVPTAIPLSESEFDASTSTLLLILRRRNTEASSDTFEVTRSELSDDLRAADALFCRWRPDQLDRWIGRTVRELQLLAQSDGVRRVRTFGPEAANSSVRNYRIDAFRLKSLLTSGS
jgi:hypothetical protein